MSEMDYARKPRLRSKGRGTGLFDGIQAFVDSVWSVFRMVLGKWSRR